MIFWSTIRFTESIDSVTFILHLYKFILEFHHDVMPFVHVMHVCTISQISKLNKQIANLHLQVVRTQVEALRSHRLTVNFLEYM